MNNKEEQCDICELYNVYNQMIADGIEPLQAFHTVVEEIERDSFKDGFLHALFNVHDNVSKHIDELIGDCDCEECTCGEQDDTEIN